MDGSKVIVYGYDSVTNGFKPLTVSGSGGTNVTVTNFPATQAISAVALPLPAGASTSALQTTGNSSLSSINTKIPAQGQAAMAFSMPVAIASDQSAIPVSASALPLPAGAATSALQTTGNTSLADIDSKLNTLGRKTMAGSVPVTIASDQGLYSVTITSGSISVTNTVTTLAAAPTALASNQEILIKAFAATTIPPTVADGQPQYLFTDQIGRVVAATGMPRELQSNTNTTIANTAETTLITAIASVSQDVACIVASNTSATVGTRVDIRSATGGTVRFSFWLPALATLTFNFDRLPLKQAAANNNWTAQLSATPTGGDVRILTISEQVT